MTEGNRNTADRMIRAENNFISLLIEIASITEAQAAKVLNLYRKGKLVKMDAVGGRIMVKHGAYLDRETIIGAANN